MECLNCDDGKTRVINTIKYAGTVYRSRACSSCGHKFWTEEIEVNNLADIRAAEAYKKMKYRKKE